MSIFDRPAWLFRRVEGSLFTAPVDYSLAHCVGADLHMGAGIAVTFRRKFGKTAQLRRQNIQTGGVAVLKNGKRFIYYLTTKRLSTQKPKLFDLIKSLIAMRAHMKKNGVTKLAIPKIGCGLDRLQWDEVFDVLKRIFSKLPIEIVLYDSPKQQQQQNM